MDRQWWHILVLVEVGAGTYWLCLTKHARFHVDEFGGELWVADIATLEVMTGVFFRWNCR